MASCSEEPLDDPSVTVGQMINYQRRSGLEEFAAGLLGEGLLQGV